MKSNTSWIKFVLFFINKWDFDTGDELKWKRSDSRADYSVVIRNIDGYS